MTDSFCSACMAVGKTVFECYACHEKVCVDDAMPIHMIHRVFCNDCAEHLYNELKATFVEA